MFVCLAFETVWCRYQRVLPYLIARKKHSLTPWNVRIKKSDPGPNLSGESAGERKLIPDNNRPMERKSACLLAVTKVLGLTNQLHLLMNHSHQLLAGSPTKSPNSLSTSRSTCSWYFRNCRRRRSSKGTKFIGWGFWRKRFHCCRSRGDKFHFLFLGLGLVEGCFCTDRSIFFSRKFHRPLCQETLWGWEGGGLIGSVLLVGGTTTMTTALMRCENVEIFRCPETQVLFSRVFSQFKRFNGVSKVIENMSVVYFYKRFLRNQLKIS